MLVTASTSLDSEISSSPKKDALQLDSDDDCGYNYILILVRKASVFPKKNK